MSDRDAVLRAMGLDKGMTADMNGIERSLGRIEGKLETIESSHRKVIEDLDEHKAESREGRSKIYAKVEATNQSIAEVKADVAEVKTKVKTLSEKLEQHERGFKRFNDFEQRFLGVAWFMSAVGLTLGVVVAAAWKWIAAKFGLVW